MSRSRVPGDPDLLPSIEELETVHGPRVATSTGERLMVILAAVVLVAGALIAVGNVLPETPATAEASPRPPASATPRPTRTPRPTPTPPPLRELALEPGRPGEIPEGGPIVVTWIRARVDLPLVTLPDERSATQIGVLAAGEVARAEYDVNQPEWVPTDRGYIHVGDDPDALVDGLDGTRSGPHDAGRGVVDNLLVGRDRIAATAWQGSNGFGEPVLLVTEDGRSWRSVELPVTPWSYGTVAWGPSGWLMASGDGYGGGIELWTSDDAERWQFAGVLRDVTRSGAPGIQGLEQLVGSEFGYLLSTYDGRRNRAAYWYSTDGRTWLETDSRGIQEAGPLVATPTGFYLPGYDELRPSDASGAWWLGDGRRWRRLEEGPSGFRALVAPIPDGLLGVDVVDAATQAWRATATGRSLTWSRDEHVERLLENVIVNTLKGNGERALLAGWNQARGVQVLFETDGREWRPLPLPGGGDGSGWLIDAAVTSEAAVLVERRVTLQGDFSVLWSRGPGDGWRMARQPIAIPPPPSGEDCPQRPTTAFDFMLLDPADAVACFGDAPLAFRAWAFPCDGCEDYGLEPAWLAVDGASTLYLLPVEHPEPYPAYSVVVHPDAEVPGELSPGWLDLTGHFADPAADDCRADRPLEAEPPDELALFRYVCQRTFVVTSAVPVDGP